MVAAMPGLLAEIDKRTGGKGARTVVQPALVATATVSILEQLKKGITTVKIRKASRAGVGYFLIAHSDKRNDSSVWALCHIDRPEDKEDQVI